MTELGQKALATRSKKKTETGNKVAHYRLALGLSQNQLADRCDPKLSAKTIARVETADKTFAATTYHRILNALNRVRKERDLPSLEMKVLFPNGIE
jgi:predicted transcriptional regulator